MRLSIASFIITISLGAAGAVAQPSPELVAALTKPVAVERDSDAVTIPLRPHMGKFAMVAQLEGVEREFIFDTGSPSMISRQLADELGLKIIGSNVGRDANGREVKTEFALIEQLEIGGVTFRQVPVTVFDFTSIDPHRCFIDAGVIGSEIMPGSAWKIDASEPSLTISASAEALGDIGEGAIVSPLHDFGFPHAPIFEYRLGDLADRGLFDTGSSDTITLFEKVAEGDAARAHIVSGTVRIGRGSHGVSAGGAGEDGMLMRFEIDGMMVGETALGRREATTRVVPPSLIGLGILASHDVTIDFPGKRFILTPRAQPEERIAHPGFSLMASGDEVRVTQLFEGSAAAQAGLRLGDHVVMVDERDLTVQDAPCETTRWLVEDRPAASARSLTVLRGGERMQIRLQPQ